MFTIIEAQKGGECMARITLKAARINAGLTQDELAEKLGISRNYYQKLESGQAEMRPVYLYGLCQVLGFGVDDIILPSEYTISTAQVSKEG